MIIWRQTLLILLTLLACLAPLRWSEAAVVYRSSEGWSVEGDDTQIAGSAAEQMHLAEQREECVEFHS